MSPQSQANHFDQVAMAFKSGISAVNLGSTATEAVQPAGNSFGNGRVAAESAAGHHLEPKSSTLEEEKMLTVTAA